jgi:hypothetical protein
MRLATTFAAAFALVALVGCSSRKQDSASETRPASPEKKLADGPESTPAAQPATERISSDPTEPARGALGGAVFFARQYTSRTMPFWSYPGLPRSISSNADTPEQALGDYSAALKDGNVEAYLATLAEKPAQAMAEVLRRNKECAKLEEQLIAVWVFDFGQAARPHPRAWDFSKVLSYRNSQFEVVGKQGKSESEVELEIQPAAASTIDVPKQWKLLATKEDSNWKLSPPEIEDFSKWSLALAHYTKALRQLVTDVDLHKFKTPEEAFASFSRSLRRGKAAPGTPEESLEIYEATQWAGDEAGFLGILDDASRRIMEAMMESSRRNQAVYLAYYDALEARFGPQPGADRFRQMFAFRPAVAPGFSIHEITASKSEKPDRVKFSLRNTTYLEGTTFSIEQPMEVRKERGGWKISSGNQHANQAREALDQGAELFEPKTRMIESLTKDILAGKFKTIEEQRAAYREASDRLQETRKRSEPAPKR